MRKNRYRHLARAIMAGMIGWLIYALWDLALKLWPTFRSWM